MIREQVIVLLKMFLLNSFSLVQSNLDAASLEWGFCVPTEVSNQSYIQHAAQLLKGCRDRSRIVREGV